MSPEEKPRLDVVLPVHNEAACIGDVIGEIHRELSPGFSLRLVVCEDGSTDGTREILTKLAEIYPMRLITSKERKGYARAILDGFAAVEAPHLLILDSDGQCEPKNFSSFWPWIQQHDIVIGWRKQRPESALRLLLSRSFKIIHDSLFHLPIHDPSCPYILTTERVIRRLSPRLGLLTAGFWWEFMARAYREGFSIKEVSIDYRNRTSGKTRVYRLQRLPGIALTHLVGLIKIWHETRPRKSW